MVVEALRYMTEGRGFYTCWGNWGLFIDITLSVALWPLGSTQHLREKSTRHISLGVKAGGA